MHATLELGGGEITAKIEEKSFDDGKEYSLSIQRENNQLYLKVEGYEANAAGPMSSTQLNLGQKPELHIGGIPKDSNYYGWVRLLFHH